MEIITQLAESLKNRYEILLGFVFGSVLKNKYFKKESDIDIGIAGEKEFSADFLLQLNLDLSNIFNREFDIVDLNRVSGTILQQILCTGTLVVNKYPELYARLIKKMWYDQSDVMPNTRYILKYRRDKFLSAKAFKI